MKHQLLVSFATLVLAIVAAIIVMIIHEFTKAMAYSIYIRIYNKKYNKEEPCKGIFKFHRYIDPVGVIFAATNNGIFSKQYPFVIRSKKASLIIGIAGYVSLAITFIIASICYRIFFGHDITFADNELALYYVVKCAKYLVEYIAFFSATLFSVNIYPMATFDIALIIAGTSPIAYIKIRKYDIFYKLIFIIMSLIGIFSTIGVVITSKALGF